MPSTLALAPALQFSVTGTQTSGGLSAVSQANLQINDLTGTDSLAVAETNVDPNLNSTEHHRSPYGCYRHYFRNG